MLRRSRAKPRLETVPLPATSRRVKFANSATPAHEFSCSSYFRVGGRCAAGTWVARIERADPAMRRSFPLGARAMACTLRLMQLAIVGALMTPALADTALAQKINWRLTTYSAEGSQDYRDYVEAFARNAELLTGCEVKIQTFCAGILAPPFEGPQAVQKGIADLAFFFPGFMVNQDPANALLGGLPGGKSAEATMAWLFQGGGLKHWTDFRRGAMNLHPIISSVAPTEIFAHSHRPIRTAEDLKGLKIRTTGAWAAMLKDYFGATPTVLPPSEIYPALERRVIDATEYITPSINYAYGLHNIA